MHDDVLLRFLGKGLIEVGGDDAKLEKLRLTVGDLAESMVGSPAGTASRTLVAIDPDVPPDDPVIKEALSALSARWPTHVNTFSGVPVLVARAMLLAALVRASTDDDGIAVAVVASARNGLPFMELGDEGQVWGDVVANLEAAVDARAEAEWATPGSISIPALPRPAQGGGTVQVTRAAVDRQKLSQGFQAAAAAQGQGGYNPHYVHNNPVGWASEFAARASVAVADAVDAVIEELDVEAVDLSKPMGALAEAVAAHVGKALAAVGVATAGLQRRTDLLWWKEAMHSPSARESYRDMEPEVAAALMALDLHGQVPDLSPASVAAFLRETVESLRSVEQAAPRPISDLIDLTRRSPRLAPLRDAAARLSAPPRGRGQVLALIGHGIPSPTSPDDFRAFVGVRATTPVSPSAWASWLFRELQSARATKAEG